MKKKYIRWILWIAASPFILFIILCVLIYLPPIQNYLVDKTAEIASEKTKMNISVGHVSLSFPLDLVMTDVKATSAARDTLLEVDRLQVKVGMYDSTLFHRVIKQFMVQAGDPKSKNASDTATLGAGDVGYTIPAEFNNELFHKKGALAAARQGDEVNPEKASSGCQFYIVTGRKFTEPKLLDMENQINEQREENIFNSLAQKHMKEIYKMRKAGDNEGLLELQDTLESQASAMAMEEGPFKFTKKQIDAYTTIGGTPHLDGAYTVFGEVIEGMDTIEKIENSKTGRADRPTNDIRILKATVVE